MLRKLLSFKHLPYEDIELQCNMFSVISTLGLLSVDDMQAGEW